MRLMFLPVLATLALAACETVTVTTITTTNPDGTTTTVTETTTSGGRASLTAPGVQTVTLEIRNASDLPLVSLATVVEGRAGPNLLPPGTAIPPGGTLPLPVAAGRYLFEAGFQAPGAFQPGRAVQRHVIVPRFPPNPPPRLRVTLR